ncbi:MAG TPA: hypothetical protein VFR48_07125, partial [Solirubrobacteraceae bacterium]|nr:hypothetical protein [Solirubrobacteraceae bacterium]
GRNRQVRRMCEAVGYRVLELERIAFGPLMLGNLPRGSHRRLDKVEVERLREASTRIVGKAVDQARGPSAASL